MDRPEGKLILKTLPDEEARKAVIVYLCKLFNTVPQKKIVALLQNMPVVLSHNVPANAAQKVIADLQRFGANVIYVPQIKLGESPLRPPSNPQEIMQKIKRSRKEIRSLHKEYTRMLKTFYKQDDRLIELARIQALIDAGFRIDYRKYHLPSGDIKTVEESYEKALRRQHQLSDEKLRPFEQHVHTRISGALRLLALPQVISKLKNGQSLKQDTEQFMDIANLFETQLPTLQDLYQVYQQLLVLVQHIEGNEDHPVLTEAIHSTMDEIYDLLDSLKKQLGRTAYPFSHTQPGITLGDFVIQQLPEENNLGALFEVTQSILDKFSRVYARLIARLAHSAEIVEELVGLPRLPEPPKK